MICFDILGEIIETAVKDSSETVDQVCDSIMDMLNLNIINLDSPGIYLDPIFRVLPPMELELEERDELILLDSPAPAPTPATDTDSLHPYGATDIRTMTDEERAARKKAKKAQKKKRSKEAKKQKKMLKDSETQIDSNWAKWCNADADASDPPPSAPCEPLAPPTPTLHRLLSTPTPTP